MISATILSDDTRNATVAELVACHRRALRAYCARILCDATLADDVLQEVFLDAHRDLDSFDGRTPVRGWLFGIAYHRCLDAIRSRRRRATHQSPDDDDALEELASLDPGPAQALERRQWDRAVEESLACLPPAARATVILRYQQGLSYAEMALLLHEDADTLRARVVRALPVLRRHLETRGFAR